MKVAIVTQCLVCGRFKMINGEWSYTDIYDKIMESVEEGIASIVPDVCGDCRNFDGIFAERAARKEREE